MYYRVAEYDFTWIASNPIQYQEEIAAILKGYKIKVSDLKFVAEHNRIAIEVRRQFGEFIVEYDVPHGNVKIYAEKDELFTVVLNDDKVKSNVNRVDLLALVFFHISHNKDTKKLLKHLVEFI